MARPKKQEEHEDNGDTSGEYQRPDAKKAFNIYDVEIAPNIEEMARLRGECSQPWKDIKKIAHFPQPVVKFILKLEELDDDQKREHYILALNEGMAIRGLGLPDDLITRANGEAGNSPIPVVERKRAHLTAIDGGGEPDFDEADKEELAGQKTRPSIEKAQAEADAEAEQEPVS